jgi:predicted TPR repeat methyltransferase
MASSKQAIFIKPDYAEAYSNLGNVLQDLGQLDEAKESYNKALALKPDYIEAYSNLGKVLQDLGEPDEAIKSYNKVLTLKPDWAEAHYNLGNVLKDQGKLDKAMESLGKALSINPDFAHAHINLGFALLAKGNLKQGLNEYEWRWKHEKTAPKKRFFSQPEWNGEADLSNLKILIWGEQGPQDMVIWSSLLSQIKALAQCCTLECTPKLVPLFIRSFPEIHVQPENFEFDIDRKDFDYHLPIGSLFKHFTSNLLEGPEPKPFLKPNLKQVTYWKNRLNKLGSSPFVGISWKSPLITPQRSPNYTELWEWESIFKNCNATFINLQSTDHLDDLDRVERDTGRRVHDFKDLDQFNNLDEVAALTKALDLTISVSTAVAAISAGVGTPTWVISWKQSPWNNTLLAPRGPSVKFFQRDTWDKWGTTFEEIEESLVHIINNNNFELQ